MFEGHTDVVTEGDLAAWSVDPFGAEIARRPPVRPGQRRHEVRGRRDALRRQGASDAGPFPGRIVVAALVDEEGMMLGAKHFVATGRWRPSVDGVICCEPEGGEICPVAKGALRLRVDFTGAMAHGAMPQHGRNPLPVAGPRPRRRSSEVEQRLQAEHGEHAHLGCDLPDADGAARRRAGADERDAGRRASVWLDVRTIPGVDHEALVARSVTRDGAGGAERRGVARRRRR